MKPIELLAPAGNLEKLHYAYRYGADAVYVGLDKFSLRQKADNFSAEALQKAGEIKGDRKLYCAVNALFHQKEIARLEESLDEIGTFPFDAFIVSDLGAARLLRSRFPETELHLSTQASCLNAEAVKTYRELGFSRIILGREVRLEEIADIKAAVPEMELECFVHGAMCLAYSGRCFLSAYLADRSGNEGSCAHSCRWNWRVLEESQRPGEYLPIVEDPDGGYTTVLSSKDLCMIDYVAELRDAGIDSLKIEGRMKSLYYTAVVTRAYRKAIDSLEKPGSVDDKSLAAFRDELFRVSHREYSTGFFFSKKDIETPCMESYQREYLFLGTVGEELEPGHFLFNPKNHVEVGMTIEFVGPEIPFIEDGAFLLYDDEGNELAFADHGNSYRICPSVEVEPGYIVRGKL
ncbi:peptidase U32 family protein [Sediminispirochaeta bajacaliforniensis]|uniref:peptidase U32 family protein n=1 Tax=Sediminispirochaeta bajacaliforniensis TaxID=148 RepID=UPI0003A447D9|nr:U32 family peptidase [Sediminispirochaeta bajacaliforniensis]